MTTRHRWRHTTRGSATVKHAFHVFDDGPVGRSECGLVLATRCTDRDDQPMCRLCARSVARRDSAFVTWRPEWVEVLAHQDRLHAAWRFTQWVPEQLPADHVSLVVNDGWSRVIHVFDSADQLGDEFVGAICDLHGTYWSDVESAEVLGPDPTWCRRCRRLLYVAAGHDPGPLTMADVAQERSAKSQAVHVECMRAFQVDAS